MRGARGVSVGGSMYARRKGSCGGWLSIRALKAERRSRRIVRQTRGVVGRTRSVGGAQEKARLHPSITALKAERRSWCIVRQTRGAVRETRSVGGAQRKAVRSHYEIRPYAHDGCAAGAAGPGILRQLGRERRRSSAKTSKALDDEKPVDD